MALEPRFLRMGGVELFCSGFHVAEAAVEGRQFGTQAEDRDVDSLAAEPAKMVLGRFHDAATDPGALMSRIDGQHADIATQAAELSVDGSQEMASGVFGDQNDALFHHCGESFFVDAGAFEKSLNGKSRIDELDQPRTIDRGGLPYMEVGDSLAVHTRILKPFPTHQPLPGSCRTSGRWIDPTLARDLRCAPAWGPGFFPELPGYWSILVTYKYLR